MPKLTYDSARGLIQETGSGVTFNSDSITFSSMPVSSVQAVTTSATVTSPGVFTVSGSAGVLTVVMPLASAVPGAQFVFRSTSADAHILTGSQESQGTKVFAGIPGSAVATQGSRLTLPAVLGSSVTFVSDGRSFLLTGLSGSCTIAGT